MLFRSLAKKLGQHWELKLNVRDLLGEKIINKQFNDVTGTDGQSRTIHEITRSYRPGTNLGLSVVWKP